jgi:histidine ammonia-lyase
VEPLEIVLACEHTAATRALHGPKPDTPLTTDLETARQALRG